MPSKLRYRSWWLTLSWGLLSAVVALSLLPPPPMPDVAHADKMGHLLAYTVMMLCFGQLYRQRLWPALMLVLLGVAIEFLQELTGRWFELRDMLANGLGVLTAWLLLRYTPLSGLFALLEGSWARKPSI